QRQVALKLLPSEFAEDSDRLGRFQREAQVLASLNHPHIAQIYGIQGLDTSRCIVMELVEGETLEERLRRGSIPVDEALTIAKQIVDALEAAHERGVIHRDLKPANIKLTADGRVKILDFGLAKVFNSGQSPALSNSPTMMTSGSMPGMILGTAAYMSPEQARGREVNSQTDLWALGCVLYEVLSGRQAFGGETMTDILGSIVKGEPDWNALPKETPPRVIWIIRQCLQKNL